MADSDSDLEVIEELPAKRYSSSQRRSPSPHFEDDDVLLDLDDIDVGASASSYTRALSTSKRKSNRFSQSPKEKSVRKTPSPTPIVLSDDSEDCGSVSVATEVVRDDDLDSLPSIAPPSPPMASQGRPTSTNYGNRNLEIMEMDDYDDGEEGIAASFPMSHSSSANGGTVTTAAVSKSSSQSSGRDDQDVDFDEMFQDAEFESLSDYLAKIDNKKKAKEKTPVPVSKKPKTTSATSSGSSASTTSKSVPSFSNFARQTSSSALPSFTAFAHQSAKANPQKAGGTSSKTSQSSDTSDKAAKSYQVNLKEARGRGGAKKKDKENVAALSRSAPAVPPQPPQTDQGPNRQKKPKDVLKMIVLQISESILTDDLAAKLIDKELRFEIASSPAVANSILFEHNVPYKMFEKDMQVHEKVHKEIDANMLINFPVDQHLELLQGELDRVDPPSSEDRSYESLTEWIRKILAKNPGKKITLLIQGLEAYLRKIQRAVQKEYRDRVLNGDNPENGNGKKKRKANTKQGIKLSRYEIQNALISTQLETQMNYRFHENSSDLALLLLQYAKSVGEAPYKQEKMKSDGFDWYAVADAVGGIPVEENGQGMRSLWLAQLQQFPKVGQESALAIARVYGSPKQLCQAYRRCSTVEEGKSLLTNIQVTMGVGPLAKTRRLGPEASKKIYRFFTSTDGEREIDG